MNMRPYSRVLTLALLVALSLALLSLNPSAGNKIANPLLTQDATGTLGTFTTTGGIDISNPFFQELGTNGRTCNSSHATPAPPPPKRGRSRPPACKPASTRPAAPIPSSAPTTAPTAPVPTSPPSP